MVHQRTEEHNLNFNCFPIQPHITHVLKYSKWRDKTVLSTTTDLHHINRIFLPHFNGLHDFGKGLGPELSSLILEARDSQGPGPLARHVGARDGGEPHGDATSWDGLVVNCTWVRKAR